MTKSSIDIQLSELKDINTQLNTTIKLLTDIIVQKDKALIDMQTRIEETSKEMKFLRKQLLGQSKELMPNPYENSDQLTIYSALGIEPEK